MKFCESTLVTIIFCMQGSSVIALSCRVPARWGPQQTTLAPGSNETRARDPLVRLDKVNQVINYQKMKNTDRLLEPGTSQYTGSILLTAE